MRMSEGTGDTRTERQRLLEDLDQLEKEQRALNLRDRHALDECQRKIEALRNKIRLLDLRRR
jgi:hypothetical protein